MEEVAAASQGTDDKGDSPRVDVVLSEPSGSQLFRACVAVEVRSWSKYGSSNTARAVYDEDGKTVASG